MGRWSLKRLRWEALRLYRHYGWPLPAAVSGTALAVVLAGQGQIRSVEARTIVGEQASVIARPTRQPLDNYSKASLQEFYTGLPAESERFAILKSILATAESRGVLPRSANYKFQREPHTSLVRYELTLPLVGRWSDLQGFLSAVLVNNRSAVIDALQLKREGTATEMVEGVLRISLLLARSEDGATKQGQAREPEGRTR